MNYVEYEIVARMEVRGMGKLLVFRKDYGLCGSDGIVITVESYGFI